MKNGTWLLMLAAACGSPPEARQPQGETSAEASPAAGPESASSAAPAASASAAAQPGSEFAVPSVAEVCEKLCVRTEQNCTKESATTCRASCDRYVRAAEHCENDVRRALQCQLKAKNELICSHQADPKCAQAFRGLKACESGETGRGQGTEQNFSLPASWTKVHDDQLKFTVSLPPGAALDPKAERRTWKAEDNGITYVVSQVDPPKDKPSNKTFLQMAIAYVGARCQMAIKLHGQFESKGKSMMQWDSNCPDKSEWHGAIHVWDNKSVVTAFHAPAGAKGVLEPYFYSLTTD